MKERLSVTVPQEVINKLREMAREEKRNLSNMVSIILEEATEKKEKAA